MENQNHPTYEPREEHGWKVATGILGLLFLIAAVFAIVSYSKYRASSHHATDLGTQLDSTRTQLMGELATLNVSYDEQISINDTLSVDLQEKIKEVEDLQVRIAQAKKDLKNSQANAAQIKSRLAQMEELKIALEKDIMGLKEQNQTLVASNQSLNDELTMAKDQVITLNTKVLSLTQANEKLVGRLKTVAPAGFRADNFTVTSADRKDKMTTKGRKIDEVKVTFDLNNIPDEYQGSREIYLVLTEFNGNPVAAVPAKDVNLKFGEEPVNVKAADLEKVSLKSRQQMTMSFEPTEDLDPGVYNLIVYADNGYLGSTGFQVSK